MLIDSHIHFDDPRFDHDRAAVYKRAFGAGIRGMILPGITAATWGRTKQSTVSYPQVFPAYGLHPYFIDEHEEEHLDQLSHWIEKEQPIALGECGLDYFLPDLDRVKQRDFFVAQLQIAKEYDLPVIIHARSAVEDVIQFIRQSGNNKGMVHSYNGSLQQARQLIDLGFYLSFGAAVTYSRANKLRRLIAVLPLENLLLETDAPDQPGAEHVGQRNEPSWIIEVLAAFVSARGESAEDIARQTSLNALNLFNIKGSQI